MQAKTINVRAVALDPIHHGAGTAGNTSLLRVQEVLLPDGDLARVPFVSGNSIKHRLREAMVHHAVKILDVPDHSMSNAAVNLLFSGGALTATGANVDLELHRKFQSLWPSLGLCGYAAGNTMMQSKLAVSHWHLVCSENFWRLPTDCAAHKLAALSAAALRSSDFGTRMAQTNRAGVREILVEGDAPGESGQMIYDFETIAAGALLYGSIRVANVTPHELAALHAGIGTISEGVSIWHVAAKTSVGFGRCKVALDGLPSADVAEYEAHLRDNRDEALAIVEKVI